MATHSEALGRFNAAVQRRDLEAASTAAREMSRSGPVSLHCALELLILLARAGDRRFEAAARRWLVRLGQERRAAEEPHTLTELQIASVAVAGLADERISKRCEGVLRALVRWVEEGDEEAAG
ncbi:MAG TPA: hypothetical protein VHZ54_16420 [Solirubrobacterales bacterium]|nr:hypothetical protein [Solirubrobacterales bacterium]